MEELLIEESTFDPCLLYRNDSDTKKGGCFGIVGVQTNDTLVTTNPPFIALEEVKIIAAKLLCKPRKQLTPTDPISFNGALIQVLSDGTLLLNQEN